jgi:hypothetical protein
MSSLTDFHLSNISKHLGVGLNNFAPPGLDFDKRYHIFLGTRYVNPTKASQCVLVAVSPRLNPPSRTRFFFKV